MTKVELYVKGYTRQCSNELIDGGYHEWLTPENALCAAEIAKEECREEIEREFLQKAEMWLKLNVQDGYYMGDVWEDFKEYMTKK